MVRHENVCELSFASYPGKMHQKWRRQNCLLHNQGKERGPNIKSMLLIIFDREGTVHEIFLQARQLNSNSAQIFGSFWRTKLTANIHNDGRTQIHWYTVTMNQCTILSQCSTFWQWGTWLSCVTFIIHLIWASSFLLSSKIKITAIRPSFPHKCCPFTCQAGTEARQKYSNIMLQLIARRDLVVSASPWLLYTLEWDPVPTVQEAGWASEPVWTGTENSAHTGVWTFDCQACSESLHKLC